MPRFSPAFLDELKARLRPSDVVGQTVKLRRQGNEYAGLSPFTEEKTPSFFVNDQKGFFHCFSSGKHGDVIAFLQETQNLTFYEAVERLAEQAGMELPKETPQDAERAKAQQGLSEACEAAAGFFQAMLRRSPGAAARAYLERRGVNADQIAAFRIGYAPAGDGRGGRAALCDDLIGKGFSEDVLVAAGLVIRPDNNAARRETYDRFRDRIMFPITGPRDRVIAFGGRALNVEARAKYLNSPETPLFHKGGVLYNLNEARKHADDANPIIVCEGYMDVVALWGAGVKTAAAPLGTALTPDQIALLWRVSDEPVLCFDGDKAGLRAAYRSIDRALPLLKPGKSLSFAFLPEGQDPDDLLKSAGVGAFRETLRQAEPLASVLWRRETEVRPLDTPERRAALRSHLRSLVKVIADADVRAAYGAELKDRLDGAFAPRGGTASAASGQGGRRNPWRSDGARGGRYGPAAAASPSLKARGAPTSWSREATLLLAAIRHPGLVERQEASFLSLQLYDKALESLRCAIINAVLADPGLDSETLKRHLLETSAAETLGRILGDETLNRQSFLQPETELDTVEWGWRDALRHHLLTTTAKEEVAHSASESYTADGEGLWKATVIAREELKGAERDENNGGEDGSNRDFENKLEAFRQTFRERRGD